MAIIYSYPTAIPEVADLLVGTEINSAGEDSPKTRTFTIGSVVTLAKSLISLQDVVSVGNTITVPVNKSKGIDITLANLGTVGQSGVSVTVPNQTGTPYPSPDAYVAKINGQSPGTLSGFIGGFVVDTHGLDNIGFYADLRSDSGTSGGCVIKSFDPHVGDLFRGQKEIGGINSTVFKVEHNGNATARSLFLADNQDEGYSQIGVEDYLFYVTYPSSNLRLLEVSGNALALTNSSGGTAVILNNLTTTRSYTLPNASGTFALTSDLTNLVTTNTVQTITGNKTFNGGLFFDAEQAIIDMRNRYDTGASISISLYDTAVDPEGLRIFNASDSGTGIAITNSLSGSGFYGVNSSTGILMTLNALASSTGDLLRCLKNNVITTKVDTNGNITAPSFVKTGGTDAQFLKADGSTSTMPTLQQVTEAGSTTTASVIAVTSGKVLIGTTDAGQPTYGSNPHLVVTSPYTGGSVGGVMDLRNLSPNIVANNLLGRIQFTGKGDATTPGYTSSAIEGIAAGTAVTGTNSGGILKFMTAANSPGASPIEKMRITQNGAVQPGTDNAYSLGASGIRWSTVWAANDIIQTSDEREKKDIVDSDLGLDFVSKLRPVSFKWKVGKNEVTSELDGLDEEGNPKTKIVVTPIEGKRTHYGLIAQEVETLLDGKDFGGFIHDSETDIKGLRYDQFIPVLINAIKELKAEIEILKAK